jgi:rubredoxin
MDTKKELEIALVIKNNDNIPVVMPRFLEKWYDSVRGYWICPKCKHKPIFAWADDSKSGDKHYCKHCKWTYEVP